MFGFMELGRSTVCQLSTLGLISNGILIRQQGVLLERGLSSFDKMCFILIAIDLLFHLLGVSFIGARSYVLHKGHLGLHLMLQCCSHFLCCREGNTHGGC